MDFIDQKLIELGYHYFAKGDYNNAGKRFQLALFKLRKYDGDRMHPIQLGSKLAEKYQRRKRRKKTN